VAAAGGQIWDIDAQPIGYEQWSVKAFDAGNSLLGSATSPVGLVPSDPSSLNGLPWEFSFSGAAFEDGQGGGLIRSIEVEYVGTVTSGIGLAFDNFFATTPIPEPQHYALMGMLGLTGFAIWRRRRKA
jgi:hypothetical protein